MDTQPKQSFIHKYFRVLRKCCRVLVEIVIISLLIFAGWWLVINKKQREAAAEIRASNAIKAVPVVINGITYIVFVSVSNNIQVRNFSLDSLEYEHKKKGR